MPLRRSDPARRPDRGIGIAGWRWIGVLGVLGSLVVFLMRRGLPESPRWLAAGRHAEAESRAAGHALADAEAPVTTGDTAPAPLRALFQPPYGRRTAMMIVFHLLQTFGYYGFWHNGAAGARGEGLRALGTLLLTALTFLGYPVGSALSLPLFERFERKFLLITALAAMVVCGLAFGLSTGMAAILMFGFLNTSASNVFSNAFHIYQAEIFPTPAALDRIQRYLHARPRRRRPVDGARA
jgi:putative MFS transporter